MIKKVDFVIKSKCCNYSAYFVKDEHYYYCGKCGNECEIIVKLKRFWNDDFKFTK